MPTYEYKCTKCEEVFEFLQKMTDEPIKKCPVCGGDLTKLISGGIGVIYKGSGFYTTDYKNSSSNLAQKNNENKSKSSVNENKHKPSEENSKRASLNNSDTIKSV